MQIIFLRRYKNCVQWNVIDYHPVDINQFCIYLCIHSWFNYKSVILWILFYSILLVPSLIKELNKIFDVFFSIYISIMILSFKNIIL